MTIQEMKDKKKEKGYTYAQIANLSGVPLGTVQKIFSVETVNPRYDTLLALEHFFEEPLEVREHVYNRYERNGSYTVDDYRTLPDEQQVDIVGNLRNSRKYKEIKNLFSYDRNKKNRNQVCDI